MINDLRYSPFVLKESHLEKILCGHGEISYVVANATVLKIFSNLTWSYKHAFHRQGSSKWITGHCCTLRST